MQPIGRVVWHDPGAGGQRTVEPVQGRFADFDPAGAGRWLLAALERLAQTLGIKAGEVALRLAFEQQGPEAGHGDLPLKNWRKDTSAMMKSV